MSKVEKEKEVIETIDETNVVETLEPSKEEKEELDPAKEFENLQIKRMGVFKVKMSVTDAIYFRNMLHKAEWKGPQQAYLLLISHAEMTSIVNQLSEAKINEAEVNVSSAVIESLSFFMNNKLGKGTESAQRLFAASMLLRPAITEINDIDQKLQILSQALKSK